MTTAVSPMRWWVYGSPSLLDISLKACSRFNMGDAPSIRVITSPEVKHTEQDRAERVPANGLEQIGRAYAKRKSSPAAH